MSSEEACSQVKKSIEIMSEKSFSKIQENIDSLLFPDTNYKPIGFGEKIYDNLAVSQKDLYNIPKFPKKNIIKLEDLGSKTGLEEMLKNSNIDEVTQIYKSNTKKIPRMIIESASAA